MNDRTSNKSHGLQASTKSSSGLRFKWQEQQRKYRFKNKQQCWKLDSALFASIYGNIWKASPASQRFQKQKVKVLRISLRVLTVKHYCVKQHCACTWFHANDKSHRQSWTHRSSWRKQQNKSLTHSSWTIMRMEELMFFRHPIHIKNQLDHHCLDHVGENICWIEKSTDM